MTNQQDDFDEDFNDAPVQRTEQAKKGMGANVSAAWQGSPLFKMFILVVVVGALAAASIALFSSPEKELTASSIKSAPTMIEAPGSEAPPAYIEAVQDASKKRADAAMQEGKSAFPTPVSGEVNKSALGQSPEESQYDPLAEFRPNVPQQQLPDQQQAAAPPPVDPVDTEALSKMQSQMTGLFESWRPAGIKVVQVVDPTTLPKVGSDVAGGTNGTNLNSASSAAKIVVPAGTVYYSQLLLEANSDAQGPIMAEIMSGPFTGGRVIGQFEVTREYLIISFKKMTYRKRDYTIEALAIDPNTTLGGLVTEKDNRYFTRVLLPSAAAFLEGFGEALGGSTSTVSNSNGGVVVFQQSRRGLEEALNNGFQETAKTAGAFFRDEAAATKPLIRVASGTPMGLFFVNSVTENSGQVEPIVSPSTSQIRSNNNFQNQGYNLGNNSGYNSNSNYQGQGNNGNGYYGQQLQGDQQYRINDTSNNNNGSQSTLANGGLTIIQNSPNSPK